MNRNKRRQLKRKKRRISKKDYKYRKQSNEQLIIKAWERDIRDLITLSNGYELEDIATYLCKRFGSSDLIIKNPKYREDSGNEKEFADIFIDFGNTLIAFQVKHKTLDESKDDDVIKGRAINLINKSIEQFKTLISHNKKGITGNFKTEGGVRLEIQNKKYKNLYLISLVLFPDAHKFENNKCIDIPVFGEFLRSEFIHVFDLNQFDKITLEFSTIPDFIRYLNLRKVFLTNDSNSIGRELDFIASYKTINQFEDTVYKGTTILIDPEMWNSYIENHGQSIYEREKKNAISHVFDKFIARSKLVIGFNPKDENISEINSIADEKTYLILLNTLSKVDRVHRAILGKHYLEVSKRADLNSRTKEQHFSYRFIQTKDLPEINGILFLAAVDGKMSRDNRAKKLKSLCVAASVNYDLTNIIGIAGNSYWSENSSEDFIVLNEKIDSTSLSEETKESYRQLFNRPKEIATMEGI